MEDLWTLPMTDALDRLFAYAEEHKVQIATVDVKKHKIKFAFVSDTDRETTSNADIYNLMRSKYLDLKKAKINFDSWFNSMLGKPKAQHFQQFIGEELETFLKSDFLVTDKFITEDERKKVQDVFTELNVTDSSLIDKCVILSRMVRWEDGRFYFDDEEHIGMYMVGQGETLNKREYRCFFDFVALCEYTYAEQTRLEISSMKEQIDACLELALNDIQSLKPHIRSMDKSSYVKLWQYLFYNKVSLADKLFLKEPNRFTGGYNQKLICNIVGIMIDGGVFDLNKSQANDLIYPTNVKAYISNFASEGTESCLTREERKFIENIVKDNVLVNP